MKVKPGVYKHYKGKFYLVLFVAKHSETLEDLVVYVNLYKNDTSQTWVRPLANFIEQIEIEGKKLKRFEYVGHK